VAQSYWLDLFTGTTWEEFLAAGGEVSGFRERRWKTVQQMKPGDYLLCYLTGISRWIGVLEVVSEPFKDTTPIWKDEAFPASPRPPGCHALAGDGRPGVRATGRAHRVPGPQEPQCLDRPFSRLPGPLEAGRRPGRGGRDQLGQVRSFVRYLKPEFLDEVSESCVLEDD
jgi:EVE domain